MCYAAWERLRRASELSERSASEAGSGIGVGELSPMGIAGVRSIMANVLRGLAVISKPSQTLSYSGMYASQPAPEKRGSTIGAAILISGMTFLRIAQTPPKSIFSDHPRNPLPFCFMYLEKTASSFSSIFLNVGTYSVKSKFW